MLGYVLAAMKVEILEMFTPISVAWVQYTFDLWVHKGWDVYYLVSLQSVRYSAISVVT